MVCTRSRVIKLLCVKVLIRGVQYNRKERKVKRNLIKGCKKALNKAVLIALHCPYRTVILVKSAVFGY